MFIKKELIKIIKIIKKELIKIIKKEVLYNVEVELFHLI